MNTEYLYDVLDQEKVDIANNNKLLEEEIDCLADFYKVMGDPTRIRLLSALAVGELCVSDLCNVVGMNRSAVSHQLRILKAAKLVSNNKAGKTVYYSLADEHVASVFNLTLEHIREKD